MEFPGTPLGGGIQPGRRLVGGVSPPMAPPIYTPKGVVLVSFTSKFADNLEWIACKLITIFLIFLHVVISNMQVFFFGGSSNRGITRSKDESTSGGSRPSYSRGDRRLPTPIFLSG